ncbi:MAG: ABC-type dipeptide/oligopeptide/nickel transport system, periplasmic component [Symbiobacteriaceae bacterium]|nr:ABC-type dipeptide/oligopeptide/nickel transport system, periplasmic component [Symbiobacteriaceae bacterium]
MRKTRFGSLLMVGLLVLSLLATACSKTPETTPKDSSTTPNASAPKEPAIFNATGNWNVPPAYHGNYFATGGSSNPWWYISEPLFVYQPVDGSISPRLGTDWKEEGNKVTVTLRSGVTWSDGTPFTAKDVVANFYMLKLLNRGIWRYLASVEAANDTTVVFNFTVMTPLAKALVNSDPIFAGAKEYGKWADQVPANMTNTEKLNAIRTDLGNYKPEKPVGMGPFVIKTVTASEMILEKNPKHYAADKVAFDQVRLARANSNETIWAMNLAGELDVNHAAASKDLVDQYLKRQTKMKMAAPSDLSDFGLIFNTRKYPFSEQKFRQALAFVLDRKKIREVTNYFGADVTDYSHGIMKSYAGEWLSADVLKTFTNYTTDLKKAEALLTELGMKKNEKGEWLGKDGKPFAFEVTFPGGWGTNAESVASQLKAFGLPTKARAIEDSLYGSTLQAGNYDMATEFGNLWWGNPHPYTGYRRYYDTVSDGFVAKATGFPNVVKGPDGKDIDLMATTTDLGKTADKAAQKKLIEKLAWVTNEYLPLLTLTEKNIVIFYQDGLRVTGWPDAKDPIWQLAGGSTDKLYTTLIINGTLKPVSK